MGKEHTVFNDAKLIELHHYVESRVPDIIVLNETWLKESINNSEILPSNLYTIFRLDRCPDSHPIDKDNPKKYRRNGGGVLIAINNTLTATSKIIPLKCMAEILGIEIVLENKTKVIIATCYRVGTLGLQNVEEILKGVRTLTRKKNVKKCVLVGDFNLPHINWSDGIGVSTIDNTFLNGFAECGMVQCIQNSIHNQGSVLDILLSKSSDHLLNLKVLKDKSYCYSDHYPITFDIKIKCSRRSLPKQKMYNFNRADWPKIKSYLDRVDWESELNTKEPDISWMNFKSILSKIIDKHVPMVNIKTEFKSPWFDSECFQKCKEKEKLHREFKTNKCPKTEMKFKLCRKEFKNLVKTKMRANQWDSKRNRLAKKLWSHIKSASKNTRVPETIYLGGKSSSDTKVKADMFNRFFFDQFSEASNYDIDISFESDHNFDIDFNIDKIRNILRNIDCNKAQGPDNIHGIILKTYSDSLARPLSILFELIYNTGILPIEWKRANVVPVYKKGEKGNVENYRPILLTCISVKVMERIMYDELFCRTHQLIDSRQNGFLKNNSCAMNMTRLIESVSTTLLQDLPTDIIYFDFAKAFDTINHDLIFNKLKYQYNIEGRMLKFFKSYLTNRSQRVVLVNCTSDVVAVLSGVPQGSILGPLLFVLFINDIFFNIDENSSIGLYADDTKLWRKIATSADCDILQRDIDTLNTWCISNKMKFNTDKCKVLTVANTEPLFMNELPFTKYSYKLGDKILDYTSCERDLGIFINERFDWHDHHNFILKKGNQMLGMTKRTCHFVFDRGKKRMLYLTLVRSNFEHCSTIWRPVNIVDIQKFEALQKRAIKWINCEEGYSYTDELYAIRCKQADILPLQLHFELNDLVFFYKIIYKLIPVSLPLVTFHHILEIQD